VCGRFVAASPIDVLVDHFDVEDVGSKELGASYNVAPTDPVYVVLDGEDGRRLDAMRWGLVPRDTADPMRASKPINARLETVRQRPSFRESFEHRRCLMPANAFYEWGAGPGHKQPWLFRAADDQLLALAAIWDEWRGSLVTCAIVTTTAVPPVAARHERMPLVLGRDTWDAWLDPDRGGSELADLAASVVAPALTARPVSTRVNDVRNNDPGLLVPVPEQPSLLG
jgi:putative SOS response-associated peptidase YedK